MMRRYQEYILKLDLFPQPALPDPDDNSYQQQTNRLATRIYLSILFTSLFTFILIISVRLEHIEINVPLESIQHFESLPSNAQCPCLQTVLSYNHFLGSQYSLHQVCSSDFISDQWIASLYFDDKQSSFQVDDFRIIALSFFQTIAMFCRLSLKNIHQIITELNSDSFTSFYLLSRASLHAQISAYTEQFRFNAPKSWQGQIEQISRFISSSFLVNGLQTAIVPNFYWGPYNAMAIQTSSIRLQQEDGTLCNCTASFSCQGYRTAIYDFNRSVNEVLFIIPGVRIRCMPVDSCLDSTLECFYNQSCVNNLMSYLPSRSNVTTLIETNNSRFGPTTKIKSIVFQLMIEDWGFNLSYENYYKQCASKSCSYVIQTRPSLLDMLGRLLGLLGGFCAGLSTTGLVLIRYIRNRMRKRQRTVEAQILQHISFLDWTHRMIRSTRSTIFELNLFSISDLPEEQHNINRQKRTTRAYLILLVVLLCILMFYKFIERGIVVEAVKYPTVLEYFQLHSIYSSSMRCFCTQLSHDYDSFVRIQPVYHPICSSDFITSAWFDLLRMNPPLDLYSPFDLRRIGIATFQMLAAFCEMAYKTVNESLEVFLGQKFVTIEAISKDLFDMQIDKMVTDWYGVISSSFLRSYELFRTSWMGNQLMSNTFNMIFLPFPPGYVTISTVLGIPSQGSSNLCFCQLSTLCTSPLNLLDNATSNLLLMNFKTGCFPITPLLLSSFEIFYNQSSVNQIMHYLTENPTGFRPTILNSTAKDQSEELIGNAASRLFVNQWIINISFRDYFSKCSPSSCTYETQGHPTALVLIITIIGAFGGLSTALKILFHILLRMMNACDVHLSHRVIQTWFIRFTDRRHLSHRLSILLIGVSLISLYFFSAFKQYRQVEELARDPSLEEYEELINRYSNGTLRCSCSQASITYKSFMNVSVTRFHQICDSRFITYEWMATHIQMMGVSILGPSPFSQSFTTYFTLISNLCQLSQATVNTSIAEFLARTFIQTEINPSRAQFQVTMESMIREFQLNMALSFLQTFELMREIIHINTLMPSYRSNWFYPILNLTRDLLIPDGFKAVTRPVRYGQCDCALSKNCIQPAVNNNGSILQGLMTGCYPIEALLKSTLECFYSFNCFQAIIADRIKSVDDTLTVLNNSNTGRFNVNTSFELVLSQLFIEEWSSEISYEKYYHACAASSCLYSYQRSPFIIDIVTSILGLYGGLVIIVRSIVIPVLINISCYIKRSSDRIVPFST